jgi:hypothetical protein
MISHLVIPWSMARQLMTNMMRPVSEPSLNSSWALAASSAASQLAAVNERRDVSERNDHAASA